MTTHVYPFRLVLFGLALAGGCATDAPIDDREGESESSGGHDATDDDDDEDEDGATEHEHGDLGEQCEQSDDCEFACLVESDDPGLGYCSQRCDADADCPEHYDCDEIGNAAGRYCVLGLDTEDACTGACQDYGLFDCIADGKLSICLDTCASASDEERETFVTCSEQALLECETGCLEAFAPSGGPWAPEPTNDCERAPHEDEPQCVAWGLPPNAYHCFQGMPDGNCEDAGFGLYCCA